MILLSIILLFTGCATTYYSVEVVKPQGADIKEFYIRNTGTTNWGEAIKGSEITNFDRKKYPNFVDVRVIDSSGIIYSKYNVSLDEQDFTVVNEKSHMNKVIKTILLLPFYLLWAIMGGGR